MANYGKCSHKLHAQVIPINLPTSIMNALKIIPFSLEYHLRMRWVGRVNSSKGLSAVSPCITQVIT